jgi:hypothetical protein
MKMNNILIKIWVHNREVDLMVDFLLDRTKEVPYYFISISDVPQSITGGWVELNIPYPQYLKLRQSHDHSDFLTDI